MNPLTWIFENGRPRRSADIPVRSNVGRSSAPRKIRSHRAFGRCCGQVCPRSTVEQGSTLLLVLMTVGILSVVCLGSYLSMTSGQSRSVMRSLAWNSALPIAEAGMEEALAHCKSTNNLASDGWTNSGSIYSRARTFGGGYYFVAISNYASAALSQAIITSTGYAPWRGGVSYIGRAVQMSVQTAPPLFQTIALAATSVNFGGNLVVDSYDTTTTNYSTLANVGGYDVNKRTANAYVTVPPPGTAFAMGGGANVYGSAAVPPGGTFTYKGNSSIGDAAWVNGGNKGLQTGHSFYNFTNTAPDVVVPSYLNSASAPSGGSISGTTYTYVLNGNYNASSLTAAGGGAASIYVQGNSQLCVSGSVNLGNIVFAPGATLNLYISTPTLNFSPTISGATPPQFLVWCTPTCTSMTLNNSETFIGFIYGPELNLNGAGQGAVYGAVTAKTFSCQGGFAFHYDCGRTNSGSGSFKILSWAEL
ncbi:MAG: hypothetical protein C5B50_00555 [Verrucomicrobia bacterium]|nr:MAG: hypothetical protein C5B50_00555 [Verrucomicrobiota bacterium]